MLGYQASRLQGDGYSTQKENKLNKCSKQDLKVALILKIVRNLFQTFHLDGSGVGR